MADTMYEHEIEAALVDVLDGSSQWYEIRENTGLSEERCREIQAIFAKALESYKKRNRLC